MQKVEKNNFFFMYKMLKVTVETFAKNCVHRIKVSKTDNKSFYREKLLIYKLEVKNILDLVDKEIKRQM